MVDHNYDRIKVVDQGEVYNEIHGDVLEGMKAFEGKGGDGGNGWMGEHLVCLAYHISKDEFLDVGREAGPSIILRKECDGLQVASMPSFEAVMGGGNQVMMGHLRDIEAVFEVEPSIIKGPVLSTESIKEGEFLFHLADRLEDQWVAGRAVSDFVHESHIDGSDLEIKDIGGEELDICVVQRCVHVVSPGQGISKGHLYSW